MMQFPDSFWEFIDTNRNVEPSALRLKYHGKPNPDFDIDFAILQIECRKKYGKKLADTLARFPRFIFPTSLSGEQATSDLLASYHASLLPEGIAVADLTAGLGIDALHLSAKCTSFTAVEIDALKADALAYNTQGTGIRVACDDCQLWIDKAAENGERYDMLFIDPARRATDGKRIFALSECQPDVTTMLHTMRNVSKALMVKASPMLDITHTASELPGATRIIALGTVTECKELDAIVDLTADCGEYTVEATTLTKDGASTFAFTPSQERNAAATYAMPQEGGYIYEAYPAVMKAAPFNLLSQQFEIGKLHPNTHLYTSATLTERQQEFPGQIWRIERVLPYESKHIKRLAKEYPQMQVATRNFDMQADALRKKLGIKDGGQLRLFAATAYPNKKIMIVASPL